MSLFRPHSLQVRLAVRLAGLYVLAAAIAAGALIYQAYSTAASLGERELSQRAEDLAAAVSRDVSGTVLLALPQRLASEYAASQDNIFVVRDGSGRVIAASSPEFADQVSKWPMAKDDPSYFRLTNAVGADYYGLSVEVSSAAGPVSVSVARAEGANALVVSLLREFVVDIAWVIPLLMLATVGIGVFVIRSGLRPVREISELAARIGPSAISTRLPAGDLPSEIKPLVAAVNDALDRLERGFDVQRQFTANAAHELRTPLAIITGALESMQGDGELIKLRGDVARMNRLVEQLLRVARLDSVALEFENVDLNEIASSVVTSVAPWAIAQGRRIGFAGTGAPVRVRANAHAVEDAIRNLAENGVLHSPENGEVVVAVTEDGGVTVADHGPGVPSQDREHIFERFWRGKNRTTNGAGLGLAIVREIMKAHGGRVVVSDNIGTGVIFRLAFLDEPEAAHGL